MPKGLNEYHPSPAYHAGRFLAVCQHIQDLSSNEVNSTYVDRFFGGASTRPASVLPRVYKVAVHRVKKIEDRAIRAEVGASLQQLFQELDTDWPKQLTVQEQGLFQIGFFHQLAALPTTDWRKRILTDKGESVKSPGERVIANILFAMSEEPAKSYEYEEEFLLKDYKDGTETIKPDFTLHSPGGERVLFIEYTGMKGKSEYDSKWNWKMARYRKLGRTIEDCMTDKRFDEYTLMQVNPADRVAQDLFTVRLTAAVRAFIDGEVTAELQEAWESGINPQPVPW